MLNAVHCFPWKKYHLMIGLLIALMSGMVWAETPVQSPAPPALTAEMQQQIFDLQKKSLEAESKLVEEKVRNQQAEHKLFDEKENEVVRYSSIWAFLGFVLGLFGSWGFVIWKVKDWVDKQIESNISHLNRAVGTVRLEVSLKERTRLLVLYDEQKNHNLDLLLRQADFKKVKSMPCPADPDSLDPETYDQIVFDSIDENILLEYIKEHPRWYFAYIEGRYENLPKNSKVATANTQMTINSRLMELLTWMHWQGIEAA